jgi:hypothetical protein
MSSKPILKKKRKRSDRSSTQSNTKQEVKMSDTSLTSHEADPPAPDVPETHEVPSSPPHATCEKDDIEKKDEKIEEGMAIDPNINEVSQSPTPPILDIPDTEDDVPARKKVKADPPVVVLEGKTEKTPKPDIVCLEPIATNGTHKYSSTDIEIIESKSSQKGKAKRVSFNYDVESESEDELDTMMDFLFPETKVCNDKKREAHLYVCMDHDTDDNTLGCSTLLIASDRAAATRMMEVYLSNKNLKGFDEKSYTLIDISMMKEDAHIICVLYQKLLMNVSGEIQKKLRRSDTVSKPSSSVSNGINYDDKYSVFICREIEETIPMRSGAVIIARDLRTARKLLKMQMIHLQLIDSNLSNRSLEHYELEKLHINRCMPNGTIIDISC